MTEVVTTKVAQDAQLNLLGQRPQVQPQERQQAPIQIAEASINADARRRPNQAEASDGQSDQQDENRRESRRQSELTGPSRPRVEIREFDLGKTPAEVVGTRDVVLRFDANDDGRIDLIESQRANRARAESGSFAGLYSSRIDANAVDPTGGPVVQQKQRAPVTDRDPNVNVPGDPRNEKVPGLTPRGEEQEIKKYGDKALAEQGVGSGEAEVTQKFFGRGAEPVIGKFAAPQDQQPVKYSERAAESDRGKISEDGSGERKFYDKVAQAEPQFSSGDEQSQQRSYYDRAQDVAQRDAGNAADGDQPKKYFGESESSEVAADAAKTVNPHAAHITVTA